MNFTYTPIPLFDSLEYLESSLDVQTQVLKSSLPGSLPINQVMADYKHTAQFLQAYRGSSETFKS